MGVLFLFIVCDDIKVVNSGVDDGFKVINFRLTEVNIDPLWHFVVGIRVEHQIVHSKNNL